MGEKMLVYVLKKKKKLRWYGGNNLKIEIFLKVRLSIFLFLCICVGCFCCLDSYRVGFFNLCELLF